MKTLYRDVIVVGAGPGGSACASYLVREGVDVLLVDKETFPRDKPCGDCQSGFAYGHLKELGVLDEVASKGFENRGILLTSPDYSKIALEAPTKGMRFNTPRRIFDDIMRRNAIKDGAEMLEQFWVYDVIREDGFVRGVKAKYQGEYIEVRSKIVIGADGSHSMVAKAIDMFPDDDSNVAVVGRCYYADVPLEGFNEIHFDKNVLPGYVWVFPEKDNVANVGLGFNRDCYTEGKTLEEYLDLWIETSPYGRVLKDKKRIGIFKGWRIPSGAQAMDNYDAGVMLIGDAGSMVMPLTGEGIGPAFETAKFAAETSLKALKANDFSREMLKEFSDRTRKTYEPKYQSVKSMEKLFRSPEAIDQAVRQIIENDALKQKFTKEWFFEEYDK